MRNKLKEELHKNQYYNLEDRNYNMLKVLRRWTVNSAIQNKFRNDIYFVDLEEMNVPLLDMILRGEFVALYGARGLRKIYMGGLSYGKVEESRHCLHLVNTI